jgi:hypothetical protein
MAKDPLPAGTTYRVVRQNRSIGVEITMPGKAPYVVIGFRTEPEAEDWIKQQRKETEAG